MRLLALSWELWFSNEQEAQRLEMDRGGRSHKKKVALAGSVRGEGSFCDELSVMQRRLLGVHHGLLARNEKRSTNHNSFQAVLDADRSTWLV